MHDFTFVFVTLFPDASIINLQSENIVLFFFFSMWNIPGKKKLKVGTVYFQTFCIKP